MNPIPVAEVFTVVAEQVAGFLDEFADFDGVEMLGQRDGDHRRGSLGLIADEREAYFAQVEAQPGRKFDEVGKSFLPGDALDGGVQGVEEVGGKGEGNAFLGGVIGQVQVARQALSWRT